MKRRNQPVGSSRFVLVVATVVALGTTRTGSNIAKAQPATAAGAPPSAGETPSRQAPTDADKQAALAATKEGNRLLVAGKPELALVRFEEAHRLVGGDKLRFNLGQALAAIPRREVDAYEQFRTFLARVPNAAPATRAAADVEIAKLKARIGVLSVSTEPEGAVVTIDDRSRGPTPLAEAIAVAAGSHTIRVERQGYDSVVRSVTLAAGQELSQVFSLVPMATATAEPMPPPPPPLSLPPPSSSTREQPATAPSAARRRAAWVAGGAGLLAVGVGSVFAIRASSSAHGCDAGCTAPQYADNGHARTSALVADLGFGIGLAALSAATYLFVTSRAPPSSATATAVRLDVALASGTAALALGGSW